MIPLTGGGELAVLEDLSLLAQAEKRAAWQEAARRMAHEVKNPLTPIKLTTQRLLRRSREGRLDPQTVAEGAETILAEVASLTRLVDSFSRFAKLPAPQPHELDAVELVRQTMALFVPTHARIAWELDLPEGPLPAHWDGDMVKRALLNMVDNAIGALESRSSDPPPGPAGSRSACAWKALRPALKWRTTAPACPPKAGSTCSTPISPPSSGAPAWAWPSSGGSPTTTAARPPTAPWIRAAGSGSRCRCARRQADAGHSTGTRWAGDPDPTWRSWACRRPSGTCPGSP